MSTLAERIIQRFSTVNTTSYQNRPIEYIIVHYTTGVNSKKGAAIDSCAWFSMSEANSSADYIVDQYYVVQKNPDILNRYSWHAGGEKYNNKGGSLYRIARNANSIGIECVSDNTTGKITYPNDPNYSFHPDVVKNLEELVLYLMDKYGIDADHVIRHYDVTGKPCPGIIGWNAESGDESAWKAFKARISGKTPVEKIEETFIDGVSTGAIARVVMGEAGIAAGRNHDMLTGVAQCIRDRWLQYGQNLLDTMVTGFKGFSETFSDEVLRAVNEVFVENKNRDSKCKILYIRSFTNYAMSDGSNVPDLVKCYESGIPNDCEYLFEDHCVDGTGRVWGHFYFGTKIDEEVADGDNDASEMIRVFSNDEQIGSFMLEENAFAMAKEALKNGNKVTLVRVIV